MDAQQLFEQINALGLGFTVKSKSSGLNEDQILAIKQALASKRQNRSTTAIDAKSQSKATSGTVRIRRRRGGDAESGDSAASEAKTEAAPSNAPVATTETKAAEKDDVAAKAAKDGAKASDAKAAEAVAAGAKAAEAVAAGAKAETSESTAAEAQVESTVNAATEATTDKSDKTDKTDASEGSDKDKVEAAQAESVVNARDTADVKEAKAVEATGAKEASKVETTEKSESAKDVAKSEKDKKAAKKAEKEKKKKEQLIELAPKFEKSVGLSFGSSSFADQVPESYASETEEVAEVVEEEDDKSTMTTDEEANRRTKQARKAPAQAHESDEIGLDGDDEDEEAARSTHKKSARPSNITGTIDPALIRAMLVKDNKKFGNGSNDKNNRKPAGRTVVNSSQFYGGQNANANKNNANHSGTNFKKVKRNKQTPA